MEFPPELQPVVDDMLPYCRALAKGKYAVSIGGSYGKRTFDAASDLDFRLFCEARSTDPEAQAALNAAIQRWGEQGFVIDGCWVRTIGEIEAELDRWETGEGEAPDIVWTIWGYYVVTDVYNQAIIEDPYGILAGWRERLDSYSPQLQEAILEENLRPIRYWRPDYHYQHKVEQGDLVFTAGVTSKLIHHILQVLFALNEVYYPGDGKNLHYASQFEILPDNFAARVEQILYPGQGRAAIKAQYERLMALVDEVLALPGCQPKPA